MNKTLTLTTLLLCVMTIMHAQSFVFEKNGVELPNNTSYTASEVTTIPILTIESELGLVNKTSSPLNIQVSQTVIQAPVTENAWLSICFDQCFTTNNDQVISGTLPVRGNDALHVYFNPVSGHSETAIVKYEVINLDNLSEKQSVTITYQYGTTGINNLDNIVNAMFVNKDGGNFFQYEFSTVAERQLQILNLTGKKISDIKLNQISATIMLPTLHKGIYIYRIIENGKKIKSNKFIIK